MKKSRQTKPPAPTSERDGLSAFGRRSPPSGPRLQRAMMERIALIHAAIQAVRPGGPQRVTRESLARELEVSATTVKRDLGALEFHFRAPFTFDFGRRTYYYPDPSFELRPPIWLEPAEAAAVIMAIRSCSASRPFPFGPGLVSAFQKITPTLGGAVSLRAGMAALDAVVSVPAEPPTELECRHFELLREAAIHRRTVQMVYTKIEPGARPEERRIHPLHLAVRPDGCILIAHVPGANDRRNFDLARISSAKFTGETFAPPAGFRLEAYLAGGLDRFLGEARHEVIIRFHPSYLSYVRVHRWHPAQTFTDQPDGSAESTFHVNHLLEIMHFVLAAAGGAEAVAPAELRKMVRKAAQTLLTQHGG